MKRITSIFLLFIMLVVGARPVFAMHFCRGDLYAVSLASDSRQAHSCCGKMKDMGEGCCHDKQVELSTDEFNQPVQQFDASNILPSFDNVWFVLYAAFNYIEPDHSVIIQHYFPPGGLSRLTVDLLTCICIYRI